MENQNEGQGNVNQENSVNDAGSTNVADSTNQEGLNGGVPEGGQKVTDEGQNNGEANAVVEKEHEEAVPYARFKEVNDKLSEFTSLLETAKTDPEAKKQLSELLGIQAEKSSSAPQLTPFQSSLAKHVAPEMQPAYMDMFSAYANEAEQHFDKMLQEKLAPIMAFIGQSSLEGAYGKMPMLKEHQVELAKVMKQHPTLSVEEAGWHIPTLREKMIKANAMASQKKEQQRREAIAKSPVTKNNGNPGGVAQQGPKTVRGMVEQAYDNVTHA